MNGWLNQIHIAWLKIRISKWEFFSQEWLFSSKSLRKHCFQCFLELTIVPREIENNGFANYWRENKEYCGILNNTYVAVSMSTKDFRANYERKLNLISSAFFKDFVNYMYGYWALISGGTVYYAMQGSSNLWPFIWHPASEPTFV